MPVDKTIAVTALDTWRRWLEDEDGADLAKLRDELLVRTQNDAMLAGTAGHKMLEDLGAGRIIADPPPPPMGGDLFDPMDDFGDDDEPRIVDELEHGAFLPIEITGDNGERTTVDLSIEIPTLEVIRTLPLGEIRVERTYDTPVGPVRVNGRVDGSDGVEILDFKFTGSPDFEELERSHQWKLYLDMTGAQRFRWEVFLMRKPLKGETAWRIQERHTLRQYRYPGLEEDVARSVSQFAVLIDRYVPEYWARASRRQPEGGAK